MLSQQSTSLIPLLEGRSAGQFLTSFTMPSSPLQFEWSTSAIDEYEFAGSLGTYGNARFTTSLEVTGELSPHAEAQALQLVICICALSRLNPESLNKACSSLVDIYSWQNDPDVQRNPALPRSAPERVNTVSVVKDRPRRQIQIEE